MKCVLLVEDDESIREPLETALRKSGFRVITAANLALASQCLAQDPDIIVLDWNLPDGEGLNWLIKKRQGGLRKPVIFLTARIDLVDRIMGLELGASDYMTKPFETRELVARLNAHMRTERFNSSVDDGLRLGPLSMKFSTHEVFWREQEIKLTATEFSVLRFLLERSEKVCDREEIIEAIWQVSRDGESRALDNCILQLRKKTDPELIQTIRNVGYKLRMLK